MLPEANKMNEWIGCMVVQGVLRNWHESVLMTPPGQTEGVDYDVAFVSAAGSYDVGEDADGDVGIPTDCCAASPSTWEHV